MYLQAWFRQLTRLIYPKQFQGFMLNLGLMFKGNLKFQVAFQQAEVIQVQSVHILQVLMEHRIHQAVLQLIS